MWDKYPRLCRACGCGVIYEVIDDCDDPEEITGFTPGQCPDCHTKLSLDNTFKPKPDDIEKFFFRAMSRGWVDDAQTKPGTFPDWHVYRYDEGTPLKLIDTWFNAEGIKQSFGMTMIYYGTTLLWYMQYHGWYYQSTLPVVKAALKTAYNAHQFFGGRGYPRFAQDHYIYTNRPLEGSAFSLADGDETVTRTFGSTDLTIGSHVYHCEWVWDESSR